MIALITLSTCSVEYLRKVEKLQMKGSVDYVFCCNVRGKILQWKVNSENLGGNIFKYLIL